MTWDCAGIWSGETDYVLTIQGLMSFLTAGEDETRDGLL